MKKKIAIALTTILWTATAAIASATYVGNMTSMKFHNQGCRWEQKMNESNRAYISTAGTKPSPMATFPAKYAGHKIRNKLPLTLPQPISYR